MMELLVEKRFPTIYRKIVKKYKHYCKPGMTVLEQARIYILAYDEVFYETIVDRNKLLEENEESNKKLKKLELENSELKLQNKSLEAENKALKMLLKELVNELKEHGKLYNKTSSWKSKIKNRLDESRSSEILKATIGENNTTEKVKESKEPEKSKTPDSKDSKTSSTENKEFCVLTEFLQKLYA